MPDSLALVAWRSRFQAIKSTAVYDPAFGLCSAWRDNADEWGPPLETNEQPVLHTDGRTLKARTFLKAGIVVWVPESGALVVGWPK